ncbi:MAG: helix-hairpin-helix domain-containing protein, partial [Candidatus Natronoplasma sp.]
LKETLEIEGIKDLLELSKEDLTKVKGIGEKTAEKMLSDAEDLIKTCSGCGKELIGDETCEECLEELEDDLEGLKEEVKDLNPPEEVEKRLETTLSDIESYIDERNVETGLEAIDSLKEDIKGTIILSELLEEIEKKIDENSSFIDFSIYNKKLETVENLFKKGKYERAKKRADRILEYIEDEKELSLLDRKELKDKDITDFCRSVAGVKSLTGEKLYKQGYHTVKEVGSAGQIYLVEDTGIDGEEADALIKRIKDFAGDLDFDVDREDLGRKETPEEEGEAEEEEVFLEIESPEQLKEKTKEQEKKERGKRRGDRPDKIPKSKPQLQVVKQEGLTQKKKMITKEEEGEEKHRVDKIYWLPAVVLPLLFFLIALVLFFL